MAKAKVKPVKRYVYKPPKQIDPITKPRLSKPNDGIWWCTWGLHSFHYDKPGKPADCPDRHQLRMTLVDEMDRSRAFKEYFLSLNKKLSDMTIKEIVELLAVLPEYMEDDIGTVQ